MPGLVDRIYPWDMPALFFFVLAMSLIAARVSPWVIVPVLWLGIPFKETTVVLGIFPLFFGKGDLRLRVIQTGIALAGCVLTKVGVDVLTQNPRLGLTMTYIPPEGDPLLIQNMRSLGTLPPWFANAGLLAALFLVPGRGREGWGLKAMGLLILVGNLIFGIITELRIWFEIIPLALYGLHWAGLGAAIDGAKDHLYGGGQADVVVMLADREGEAAGVEKI